MTNRSPHERLLLELSEEAYHLWRHSPITAAYLLYLGDQIEAFRTAAADLLEAGQLSPQFDVIRGRIMTLRELQNLSLDDIQNFYRQKTQADHAATSD
jgi:hypothetical protein